MKKVCVVGSNLYELADTMMKVCAESGKNYKVVVPDKFSMLCELLYFSATNKSCTFDTQVVSVSSLAYMVLDELGIKVDTLSSSQQALVTKRAIQNCKDKLCFIKQNNSSAFYSEMSKTISQLKSSNVDLSKIDFESGKINDFKIIFEEYQKLCVGKTDNNDLLCLLKQNIKNSKVYENTVFLFVGFDSFTNQIFDIVKTISEVCDIYVGALVPANKTQKSFYDLDIYGKISSSFEDVEYVMCDKNLNFCQSQIENNLFNTQKIPSQKSDFLQVFQSKSFEDETNFVFCQIANMLKNGFRASDISVAVANLAQNTQVIWEKANLYGLPVYIEESVNLCDTALFKFFDNLFDFVTSGYKREYVQNFWQSGFLELDMFQRGQIANILSQNDFYDENFEKTQFFDEKYDFYADILKNFAKQTKLCKTTLEFCTLLQNTLLQFDCQNILQKQAENYAIQGDLKQEKIFLQIYEKFEKAIQTFAQILGDEKFVLSKFQEDFSLFCQNIKISTVPIRSNCIYIGDATDDFFAHVDVLFVLGASGDALPKSVYDCGLILDKDIQNVSGLEQITPTIHMINKRNKFKLFNLCLCPKTKLYISYSLVDGKDIPCYFVLELLQIFGQTTSDITNTNLFEDFVSKDMQIENTLFHLTNPKVAEKYLMQSLGKFANSTFVTNSLYDALNIDDSDLKFLNFDNNKQNISNAKDLFFEKGYTKVSQLENFFLCPYKHFLNYGLKLSENPNCQIDARDIGNVLHFVAENFVKCHAENFDEEQTQKFLSDVFAKISKSPKFEKFGKRKQNKVTLALLKQECKMFCDGLKKHINQSDFKPIETEYEFLEEIDGVKIKGFVDRIDKCQNMYRVIDYKSGNPDITEKDVFCGTKIQPIIYGKVTKKLFGDCSGVFLMPLKNQKNLDNYKLKGFYKKDINVARHMDNTLRLDNPTSTLIPAKLSTKKENIKSGKLELSSTSGKQNFGDMLAYGGQLCKSAVSQICDGLINCLPTKDACNFCEFRGICNFDTAFKNVLQEDNFEFDDKSFSVQQDEQN